VRPGVEQPHDRDSGRRDAGRLSVLLRLGGHEHNFTSTWSFRRRPLRETDDTVEVIIYDHGVNVMPPDT
jgi:hypothetical protein